MSTIGNAAIKVRMEPDLKKALLEKSARTGIALSTIARRSWVEWLAEDESAEVTDESHITLGRVLTDDECEYLRDVEPLYVAGDSEWRKGATFIYAVQTGTLSAGVYVRVVMGNDVRGWEIKYGDIKAYHATLEAEYQLETEES